MSKNSFKKYTPQCPTVQDVIFNYLFYLTHRRKSKDILFYGHENQQIWNMRSWNQRNVIINLQHESVIVKLLLISFLFVFCWLTNHFSTMSYSKSIYLSIWMSWGWNRVWIRAVMCFTDGQTPVVLRQWPPVSRLKVTEKHKHWPPSEQYRQIDWTHLHPFYSHSMSKLIS